MEVRPRWGPAFTFSDAHAGISGALFQERESGEGPLRRRGGQKGVGAHRTGRQMSAVTSTSQAGGHSRGKSGIEVSSRASTSPGKSWRGQGTAWSSAWAAELGVRARELRSQGAFGVPSVPLPPLAARAPRACQPCRSRERAGEAGQPWVSPTGGWSQ